MNNHFVEFTVDLPVSQFVRLQNKAQRLFLEPNDAASFLLSKWVEPTPKNKRPAQQKTSEK